MITTKILKLNEAELKFHWGKYISSIEPTTGVGNERDIGSLAEDVWVYDLEYEIHQTELEIADVKKWKEIYKAVDSTKQVDRIEKLSAYLEALSSALAVTCTSMYLMSRVS